MGSHLSLTSLCRMKCASVNANDPILSNVLDGLSPIHYISVAIVWQRIGDWIKTKKKTYRWVFVLRQVLLSFG